MRKPGIDLVLFELYRRYVADIYGSLDDDRIVWESGVRDEIRLIAERLPHWTVLDLGCGTGTQLAYLVRHGVRAVGVDLEPLALQRAARKSAAPLAVCDAASLPFASASFDLVYDYGCLHHNREAADDVLGEVARVLRPSGLYVLSVARSRFAELPASTGRLFRELSRRPGLHNGLPDAELWRYVLGARSHVEAEVTHG